MAGRPPLFDRRIPITTAIQGIFYDLAKEKHISWKLALECGIKVLAQGGESPALQKETIQKHIKNTEVMSDMLQDKEKQLDDKTNQLDDAKKELKNLRCGLEKENNDEKKDYHY